MKLLRQVFIGISMVFCGCVIAYALVDIFMSLSTIVWVYNQ